MIKNWIVTGDTHGAVDTRLVNIKRNMPECKPAETGIIILGDAGLNFYLNKTDVKKKKYIQNCFKYTIYCVRGNHEERPENVEGYHLEYDANVGNMVWVQPEFPNIKFFVDGGNYVIGGHPVLVVGGAYSVDKYWRLQRAGYSAADADIANPKKCGWFKDECLTQEEMDAIIQSNVGKKFDFVLTHTAPIDWEPTDLFLNCVDQSTVDKSMEYWLSQLKETFDWNIWLFGHYHADRVERPHVEQMFMDYENLETIWNRWNGEKTFHKEWWLPKSPFMEHICHFWNGESNG